ncbi:carboxymuconolactone decarboxylase family protein [Pseudoduganella aquatica]
MAAVAPTSKVFAARGIGAKQLPAASPKLLAIDAAAEAKRAARVEKSAGPIAPGLVRDTTELLFNDLWLRPGLAPRDRSLVTISALMATGQAGQLPSHLNIGMDNGLTQAQISALINHIAFYAGWPKAFSAVPIVADVFASRARPAAAAETRQTEPLLVQSQGSFAAGGTVVTGPAGETLHGDHAYVFYQIPPNARKLPLVMWHGAGQFSKTWGTTADGREGYQNIFLRRGYGVYVLDQPRRGAAGRSTVSATVPATPDEQVWFNMFRIGAWPGYFDGVQFPREPEALNQYFRAMTPNTGPFDMGVVSDAVSAALDKTGPAILVTHSQSGGPGWRTAIKNANVRAIVAYEPGSGFIFPEGEVPPAMPSAAGPLEASGVPLADFKRLTRIPIVIYFGDNIPEQPHANPGQDNWRVRLAMARLWRDAVNRHGGDATLVHLPELGIRGNTHFPFSDLNNVQIADLMSRFLEQKKLDGR